MFFEWLDSYLSDVSEIADVFSLDLETASEYWKDWCYEEAENALDVMYDEVEEDD